MIGRGRAPRPARRRRVAGDSGGVWIGIGIAGGILVYVWAVILYAAGFTAIAAVVVIPPVLVALIAVSNLLGGRSRRSSGGKGSDGGRSPRPPDGPEQGTGESG